jgi:hypothetical protein
MQLYTTIALSLIFINLFYYVESSFFSVLSLLSETGRSNLLRLLFSLGLAYLCQKIIMGQNKSKQLCPSKIGEKMAVAAAKKVSLVVSLLCHWRLDGLAAVGHGYHCK